MPRKPPSAFYFWRTEKKATVGRDNPGMSADDLAMKVEDMWRAMSQMDKAVSQAWTKFYLTANELRMGLGILQDNFIFKEEKNEIKVIRSIL